MVVGQSIFVKRSTVMELISTGDPAEPSSQQLQKMPQDVFIFIGWYVPDSCAMYIWLNYQLLASDHYKKAV